VQEAYFSCAAIDVIAIHAYGLSDLTQSKLKPVVQRAQSAGKKLMMQEWGMCYFDTSNNNCPKGNALSASARDANIKKYADEISQSGIPWMYWQIIPNADPHDSYDYEVSDAWYSSEGRERTLLTDLMTGRHQPGKLGCSQGCCSGYPPVRIGFRLFQVAAVDCQHCSRLRMRESGDSFDTAAWNKSTSYRFFKHG
jgi:hypothetical protein